MTMATPGTNYLQHNQPSDTSTTTTPKEITVTPRSSYAADLLTPVPAQSNSSSNNNSSAKSSHDQIMSLFNTPSPQPTAIMGGMSGDFNPMMVNPNMMMAQQQQQAAMMNMMVQPRSNMMAMMQQQQHQQQRMLHEHMIQQQAQTAAASAGFGTNVMVQPKSSAQQAMHAYQNSFHQSFIFSNDGYDNGYGQQQQATSTTNNNNMGYGSNQLPTPVTQMNMMQQQQPRQQAYPGMLMSNSLHGNSNGGMNSGNMGGIFTSNSQDDSGFPSAPMGGTVMASSGPLVSGMHQQPMNRQHSPPPDLPPKAPRKEDPFAQFGMNVFRS
jgi:hypothetical protein